MFIMMIHRRWDYEILMIIILMLGCGDDDWVGPVPRFCLIRPSFDQVSVCYCFWRTLVILILIFIKYSLILKLHDDGCWLYFEHYSTKFIFLVMVIREVQ